MNTEGQTDRTTVSRVIAREFGLPEAEVSGAVYDAFEWQGEVQKGAVVLVQTGGTFLAGTSEEIIQSWLNVNDRLEEQGVDLYSEIKSPTITAFYRFS